MDKVVKNKIFMSNAHLFQRVFIAFAGAFAFVSVYLVLFSGTTDDFVCLICALFGAASAGVYLAFSHSKIKYIVIGVTLLYSVLCVAIGFPQFLNGLFSFINNAARNANATMHYGFKSIPDVEESVAGNFIFCSVISALFGLCSAIAIDKSIILYLFSCVVITLFWFCMGLFSAPYAVGLLVASIILLSLAYREFNPKSVLCYLAVTAVMFVALSPSFTYSGSSRISGFKSSVGAVFDGMVYGSDSLPEGNLKAASGMRSDKSERLEVTISGGLRNLYLRGFVGSEIEGSVWHPTDKNVYVSDGNQGLLEYVSGQNIPFTQYARYAELSGNTNRYAVTVKNVGANSKYTYLPYTATSISGGNANYDMNVKKGLFGAKQYSFDVFAADRSSEVIQQAHWLDDAAQQDGQKSEYVSIEGQYRSFVYSVYSGIDEQTDALVRSAVGITSTDENINPAANVIRNYFRTNFEYSDIADEVGDDFITEFFGGKIKKANAAYFASAATIAFRAYGYAARYVEGYLVYAEENQTEVSVTGNYSHAWTEVYFDGMGWLPVEVTPSFFTIVTEIDPDNPEQEPSAEPVKPPDENQNTSSGETNETEEKKVLTPTEQKALSILKILLPVASVILTVLVASLTVIVRRIVLIDRKRKRLNVQGEQYGRAAYGIMQHDFGNDFESEAESYGISREATGRFTELIQKSVYGGYDLSEGERRVVTAYMQSVDKAYSGKGGVCHKFFCKYLKCTGI